MVACELLLLEHKISWQCWIDLEHFFLASGKVTCFLHFTD